ncbi:MAG: nucleotide exchange factor GrpE [Parvularculaceae bacterium]
MSDDHIPDEDALFDNIDDDDQFLDDPDAIVEEDLSDSVEKVAPKKAPLSAAEKLAKLEAELADTKDRMLRIAADLENTRRRGEREKQDAAKYGLTGFARDLLGVADNFQRAFALLPENRDEVTPEMVQGILGGIEMTEKELLKVFARNGITRVDPKGEKFDPNLHQAIAQVPGVGGIPRDHVVDVAAPGFTIGDRVLRAAMVTVSTGPVED